MAAAAHMAEGGEPIAANCVAEETGLPQPTVSKLMGRLAKAGLLVSFRGVGGGFQLGRAADRISLAEIVEAIDGPIALTNCARPDHECSLASICAVRPYWGAVSQAVRDVLANMTLANITPPPTAPATGADIHSEIA